MDPIKKSEEQPSDSDSSSKSHSEGKENEVQIDLKFHSIHDGSDENPRYELEGK